MIVHRVIHRGPLRWFGWTRWHDACLHCRAQQSCPYCDRSFTYEPEHDKLLHGQCLERAYRGEPFPTRPAPH